MNIFSSYLDNTWMNALETELGKEHLADFNNRVITLYEKEVVYPQCSDIFNALELCPLKETKVVILGQDPYHGEGQAHGLAFSVSNGVVVPPSLRNIFRERKNDVGVPESKNGNLSSWAEQGVLLLNTTLTVKAGEAASHRKLGWDKVTDTIISAVSKEKKNVVFVLWGAHAIAKRGLIDESKHLVLTAPHPSPLSAHRGFFGSRPFSHTNTYLKLHGLETIKW